MECLGLINLTGVAKRIHRGMPEQQDGRRRCLGEGRLALTGAKVVSRWRAYWLDELGRGRAFESLSGQGWPGQGPKAEVGKLPHIQVASLYMST